jgi:tetratricopeptide (TPR) repeat protein
LGGFTFANKDVAVNVTREGTNLALRVMGTAEWKGVGVSAWLPGLHDRHRADTRCDVSARSVTALQLGLREALAEEEWVYVELRHRDERLALFPLPLDLPRREPSAKKPASQTATELAQAGWEDFLFARQPEAEGHFRKALEADTKSTAARVGLAFLHLDSDPTAAMKEARAALEVAPESGLAHYALAVAADRAEDPVTALDEAWKAALDPATAVAARALVAKLYGCRQTTIPVLSEPGPWESDPLCRNRLAYTCLKADEPARAVRLARENLAVDPLDTFAQSILWMAKAEAGAPNLQRLVQDDLPALMELAADYADIVGDDWAPVHRLLERFYLKSSLPRDPIASCWAARGFSWSNDYPGVAALDRSLSQLPAAGVFPHQPETVPLLRDALERNPKDGKAALYLGHLLFHLGRHAEGREMWKKAAELGAEPLIAYRALGMAAKTLDNDMKSAREWLEKANQADGQDAIVARDLANVLFALADKAGSDAEKRELTTESRDRLKGAFDQGKGRSDFVALLARSYTRLGDHAETAKLLDSVRITIWEGAHEAHDLFEEAHLALGDAHLKAARPAEALAEFNRALEYPKNLATGRLENTCDAHIHFQRGQVLAALGRKDEARAAWQQAVAEPASKDAKKESAREQAREALRGAAK